MQRKYTIAVALAAAAIPGALALAQSAKQDVTLTATVTKFCKFDSVSALTGTINVASSTLGTSSSTVVIANGANATGILQDWAFTFNAQATCNAPSQLQLTSLGGGLKAASPVSVYAGTFLDRIDYTASGKWASSPSAALTTVGEKGAVSSALRLVAAAASGNVTVDVGAVINTSAPLLAGSYSDTLRISISPQ